MPFTLEQFYQHAKEKYQLTLLTPESLPPREISWIQLLEDINNCSFIRGGELIITTGLNARKEEDLFSLIEQSQACGACGIILNMGMYLTHISDSILTWCTNHHFPLFSMPWEIHIADLMQEYCNEILSEKRSQETRTSALLYSIRGKDISRFQSVLPDFADNYILCADSELSILHSAAVCYDDTYYYLCTVPAEIPSAAHCGISSQISQSNPLSLSVKQAYKAMQVSQIKKINLSYFSDIGLYNAALSIEDMDVLKEAQALLAPLKEQSLRDTFRLYLEKNGSVQEVAETLYLHRNTVNYRIQKGRSLLNLDSASRNLEYLFAFYLCDCLELKTSHYSSNNFE